MFLDINELDCLDGSNGGCDQVCNNENGTFSCACNDGYMLNDDGLTCDGN